jgi:transcription elongation factor Elf1
MAPIQIVPSVPSTEPRDVYRCLICQTERTWGSVSQVETKHAYLNCKTCDRMTPHMLDRIERKP